MTQDREPLPRDVELACASGRLAESLGLRWIDASPEGYSDGIDERDVGADAWSRSRPAPARSSGSIESTASTSTPEVARARTRFLPNPNAEGLVSRITLSAIDVLPPRLR